jgi:hypothetical protein
MSVYLRYGTVFFVIIELRISPVCKLAEFLRSGFSGSIITLVKFVEKVNSTHIGPRLRLGLIWGSRDDTRSDMEKIMY